MHHINEYYNLYTTAMVKELISIINIANHITVKSINRIPNSIIVNFIADSFPTSFFNMAPNIHNLYYLFSLAMIANILLLIIQVLRLSPDCK